MLLLIDLPFWRYICHLAKRTTKLERMICAAALFILVMCVALLVYFSKEVDLEDEDISKGKPQNNIYSIASCPTY